MRKIQWRPWKDPFDDMQSTSGDIMQVPCAVTPLGIMPVHESVKPGHLFKVWVGHTNFTLSEHIAGEISKEPGVEGLDILTRYRFRIVVGEQFSDAAVKKSIELGVCREQENQGLGPIISFLHTLPDNMQWGLVKLPNGKTHFYYNKDLALVELWLSRFEQLPKKTYVSWRAFTND